MTASRDLDRQLASWFDARATRSAPAGLLERSLERVGATPQRPGWLVRDRGRSPRAMGRPAMAPARRGRLFAVTAALVVVAIGAGLFLRLSPAVIVGPSGTPSIAPVPSTSVAPSPSPSETPAVVQPTGGMFAFIQASGYAGQLWVANLDGTGARQLAPDLAGSKGTPSWSPDGTRLVFTLTPLDGMGYPNADNEGSRLYMTDASGSVPQLVDTGCVAPCSGDNDAAFSRDGARLVFVRTLVHPQSGSPDPVTGKGPGSIVESVLATIDLSTGRVAELASTTIRFGGSRLENHNPRWSPDGTQIVFTQDVPYDINGPKINGFMAPSPPPALYVVDVDGQNLRQISSSGSLGDWSPDGAQIVFQSELHSVPVLRAGSGNGYLMSQYFDIYTIRPDGTDLRRLTSDQVSSQPSWTAGGRIGFFRDPTLVNGVSANTEPRQLWIMDADGSNATQLSVSPQLQQAWPISWPPQP